MTGPKHISEILPDVIGGIIARSEVVRGQEQTPAVENDLVEVSREINKQTEEPL